MMSFSARKLCSVSSGCQQTVATSCEGCSQVFCTKHFIDHRRVLGEEMNTIISEHTHLQQIFNEQPTDPNSLPLVKGINDWEEESIARIQQKAKDLRLELYELTTIRRGQILKKLRQLSEQLNETQENDNFIEVDLRHWKNTLEDLKANLLSTSTFSLKKLDDYPIVYNRSIILTLENELFEQVSDNTVQIGHNGQIAIHDASHNYTEIRGKNEYETGCHKIRLCMEQSTDSWTFLGINSKSISLQKGSCKVKSAYGWTNNNYICLNGECQPNRSTSRIEMKANDFICLIFDCDNHKIFMINERTNAKYEMVVNIDYCPFPWQLHVNLYEANSCVRILSA